MGRVFLEHLVGQAYSCKYCGTHLAKVDELLSKQSCFDCKQALETLFCGQFHSKNGPAWLFGHVVNIVPGPKEERLMTTGMHVVSDISCTKCFTPVGWKYEDAYEESQKYKIGRFILERAHVVETSTHNLDSNARRLHSNSYHDEHSSDLDDQYF